MYKYMTIYIYIHNSADVCKYFIYIYTDSKRYTCLSKRNMLEMSIGSIIPDTKGWQSRAVLKPSLAFDTRLGGSVLLNKRLLNVTRI